MIGSPLKKKMKITSESLLKDLEDRTKNVIESTIIFLSLDQSQLNWKESPQSWSILECLEHLNRYGDFYIAEINKCIMDRGSEFMEEVKDILKDGYGIIHKPITLEIHKPTLSWNEHTKPYIR